MLCEALGHEDKPPILPAAEFANSVTNWTEYNEALRQRGSFHSDEARATAIAAQVLNRMLDRPNSVRVA